MTLFEDEDDKEVRGGIWFCRVCVCHFQSSVCRKEFKRELGQQGR